MEIKFGDNIIKYGDDCRIAAHEKKGGFEPETRAYLVERFDEDNEFLHFIDVGAYTGLYSIAARLYGCSALAIEPFNDNREVMLKNFNSNFADGNHEPTWSFAAASATFGNKDFYYSSTPLTSGGSLIKNESRKYKENLFTMPLDGYVTFFNKYADNDKLLIKIDVEGTELDVLKGTKRIIGHYAPDFIIEILDKNQVKEVEGFLQKIWHKYKLVKKLDKANYVFTA